MADSTRDPDGMAKRLKGALARVRRRGYLVEPGDVPLEAWYRECEATGTPCVWVSHGRKYSRVRLDLVGADLDMPPRARAALEGLARDFARNGWCSRKGADLLKVPRDRAEELARILVRRARRWKAKQARKAVRT